MDHIQYMEGLVVVAREGQGRGQISGAVVGLIDAQHEPLAVPAQEPKIVVSGADRRLVGDRPAGAQEHLVEVLRG